MLKSKIAREFRSQYRDKPTKALARIMYDANKKLFANVEDARSVLRRIEGKSGAKNKAKVGDKSFIIEEPRPYNPYSLPKSDETSYEPFVITGHKRLAVFSDIHVPYHSIPALTAAIDFSKKEKVDGLLINGDALDFHRLSRFLVNPEKKDFAAELAAFAQLIEILEAQLNCKIYFKIGNHEERYENYLIQKAGELKGVAEFDLTNIIRKRAPNVEVIKDKRIIHANELNIVHGHEFGQSIFSPVNIARGLFLRAKVSAMQGHNHQTSEHTESNMNGKITTTWSLGCLCELTPAYLPINKWNHGFAIVDLDENGRDFEVRNKRIYKGKVL